MIDINTVGAGGGSIAWFDRDGLLKVGPDERRRRSGAGLLRRAAAPSRPSPTPTSCSAGCRRAGCSAAPWRSTRERRARRVGAGRRRAWASRVEKPAHGVLEIVVANMVRAIRAISVERGHDPARLRPDAVRRRRAAARRATWRAALGMREIIVPPAPGHPLRAGTGGRRPEGGFRRAAAASARRRTSAPARLAGRSRGAGRARGGLVRAPRRSRPRPRHSSWRSTCAMSGRTSSCRCRSAAASGDARRLPHADAPRAVLRRARAQPTASTIPTTPVEIVNFRLTAHRPAAPAAAGAAARDRRRAPGRRSSARPVWFDAATIPSTTPVYDRAALRPGVRHHRARGHRPARRDHRRLSRRPRRASTATATS